MLPTVDFCGLELTRLVLGANPFGGFSHQNKTRDREMVSFHTVERILETWERAWAAGINVMITNNESPHVVEAVKRYRAANGPLKWIAQTNCRELSKMHEAIDAVVEIGCSALYIHGFLVDQCYLRKDAAAIRDWANHARSLGVPVGVAGHAPEVHRWVNSLDAVDFHAVCFYDCGSVHAGKGETFRFTDPPKAVKVIQEIERPCIGYKIMGAGRVEARMAFDYAFESIKPGDIVNVGMHRGDQDDMVETNVRLVREILGTPELVPA